MKIACIAWGSLLWKPGPLALASDWMAQGPALPVEFARVGDKGELALAITDGIPAMPTWWARLDVPDLATAREQLRQREEITHERPEWVGSAPAGPGALHFEHIRGWMEHRGLDAVVWTALPPRFDGTEGRMPTVDEAVDYLRGLDGEVARHAEDYLRRTPVGIDTAYRRAIETRLGWTPYADGQAPIAGPGTVPVSKTRTAFGA